MIETRIEAKRGCGYRKPGGLYLVAKYEGRECCKLPFQLDVCPCCGAGIRPSRAWTWVDTGKLFNQEPCTAPMQADLSRCPLYRPEDVGRAGLIWVGEKFYPTVEEFKREASVMGISRRISAIPRGFKVGETWVLLAHRKAIPKEVDIPAEEGGVLPGIQLTRTEWEPGIFFVFKPTAVEYVVKGDEAEEEIERLERRGVVPVKVINRKPTCSTPSGT